MKNNIYVLLVILLILIFLIILFLKTRNLEGAINYTYPFSTNINFINTTTPPTQITNWPSGMYLATCQTECTSDPRCRALKSNATNTTTGFCTHYNSNTMSGTPQYAFGTNIYYKTP